MGIYSKVQLLASDMAEQFHDEKHFGVYLRIAKRFPESYVRRVMSEVKERQQEVYRKNPKRKFNWGAYFTAVIFRNAKHNK